MTNLRELVESDLFESLEDSANGFGLPADIIAPDGSKQTLNGQVLRTSTSLDPDTGDTIIIDKPVLVLRRSSLNQIPKAGENWSIKIPINPAILSEKETFILDNTQSPEHGRSIGFIRLYLMKAVQR